MSEILQGIDAPGMLEALETNSAEEVFCFSRGLPGAESHIDEEVTWFITHRRYLNSIVRTRFARNDKDYIDTKIDTIRDHFASHKVSLNWVVSPVTRPTNLGTYLEAHDIGHRADDLWMALDMQKMHEDSPQRRNLVIRECKNAQDLQVWKSVNVRGFDDFEDGAQIYYKNYVNIGFGDGMPWHHYVAWLHNTPIAASSLLLWAGIAGIYGVSTVPEARQQGVGTAVTIHALQQARLLGYRIAVLAPSDMGMGMYRRIGFEDFCTIQHYGWTFAEVS